MLAVVMLASGEVSLTLPEVAGFFRAPITVLMSYATEGVWGQGRGKEGVGRDGREEMGGGVRGWEGEDKGL